MIASPLAGNVLGADRRQFVIAEWRDAGSAPGEKRLIAPTHLHRSDDEARAGSAVLVPAGTAHTYWNPSEDPARYLIIMTPNIHHLIQAIHAMPVRTRDALAAVFEEHDSTLLPDQD